MDYFFIYKNKFCLTLTQGHSWLNGLSVGLRKTNQVAGDFIHTHIISFLACPCVIHIHISL